jgi:hypothetical protein
MMRFHRIILVFWSFGRGYEPRLDIMMRFHVPDSLVASTWLCCDNYEREARLRYARSALGARLYE